MREPGSFRCRLVRIAAEDEPAAFWYRCCDAAADASLEDLLEIASVIAQWPTACLPWVLPRLCHRLLFACLHCEDNLHLRPLISGALVAALGYFGPLSPMQQAVNYKMMHCSPRLRTTSSRLWASASRKTAAYRS